MSPPGPILAPSFRRPAAPRLAVALGLACLGGLAAGCAGGSPLTQRGTMLGSLRSSVAQLESEKVELEKSLVDLRSENGRLEDRLVQEEAHSSALASRLSRVRGEEADAIDPYGPDSSRSAGAVELPDFGPSPSRTTPAGRPGNRKAPFAEIRGRITPLPSAPRAPISPPARDDEFDLFPAPTSDTRSRFDSARSRWMPVARGLGDPVDRL